jgi:hypothetical protein
MSLGWLNQGGWDEWDTYHHEKDEKLIQILVGVLKGKYHLDCLTMDGRVLLKLFLKKHYVRMFVRFLLLWKGFSTWLMRRQVFIKVGNYLTCEVSLVSLEGLSDLINYIIL